MLHHLSYEVQTNRSINVQREFIINIFNIVAILYSHSIFLFLSTMSYEDESKKSSSHWNSERDVFTSYYTKLCKLLPATVEGLLPHLVTSNVIIVLKRKKKY